jgi:hypothetical protein
MSMDYDRLAVFLLLRTTPGFRKGLRLSPVNALNNAGFHPGESALLAASLGKIKAKNPKLWNSSVESTSMALAFNQIDYEDIDWKKQDVDSWKA